MEGVALAELAEAENERAHAVVEAITANDSPQPPQSLYPELVLKEPYAYCVGSTRPADVAPLFQTVIVDLRPLPTPSAFESRYGVNVEMFLRLAKQGRFSVRLRDDHSSFQSLDYLREIFFELPLPRSNRYTLLYDPDISMNRSRAEAVCPTTPPVRTGWAREYMDWRTRPSFRQVLIEKFALVATYYGTCEAERIVESALRATNDSAACYDWLHIFSRFRIYPFMNSLNGITVLPTADSDLLPTGLRSAPGPRLPYEIGKALICNLPIRLPTELELALKVDPSQWMRAVNSLDATLTQAGPESIASESIRLNRLAIETRREVENMAKRKRALERRFVTLSGIGIAGALSQYAPSHWQPIIGISSATLFQARSKIADNVVKFRKGSHVVAWFDLQQQLTEARN